MEISLVTYEYTHFHKKKVLRVWGDFAGNFIPVRTLSEEDLHDCKFLCVSKDGNLFVSDIYLQREGRDGKVSDYYMYVDDAKRKIAIRVENLKEIHLIEVGA